VTLLTELWVRVVPIRGYITGETLKSVEQPEVWLTISSWSDLSVWRNWKDRRERQEILKEIEPLLLTSARESVFRYPFKE
jgi:heme-degrading monooxygenase HmoA